MTVPTSTTLDYSNLLVQSHANIFNLLNNRSNIPDPADNSGARKFIYVREPKTLGRGFAGFPFVTVEPATLSSDNSSLDGSADLITWEIVVSVLSSDKMSDGSGNPTGAQYVDEIGDRIIRTVNANNDSLRRRGLSMFNVVDSEFNFQELEEQMIFMRSFTLSFSNRIRVIA